MRHILICAPMSMMIDSNMANAKLAKNCDVNTAVCVKKWLAQSQASPWLYQKYRT